MKKVLTIFLSVVYLASFGGIFLSSDCNVHSSTQLAEANIQVLHLPEEKPATSNTHPLFQFCKAVEFHKEILRTGKVKQWRPFHLLPYSNTGVAGFDLSKQSSVASINDGRLPKKLFLYNRELLI